MVAIVPSYCLQSLRQIKVDHLGEEKNPSPISFPSAAAAAAGSVGWLGIHQQACESLLMNQLFSSLTQALLPVPAIAILTATVSSSSSFFFPLHIPVCLKPPASPNRRFPPPTHPPDPKHHWHVLSLRHRVVEVLYQSCSLIDYC